MFDFDLPSWLQGILAVVSIIVASNYVSRAAQRDQDALNKRWESSWERQSNEHAAEIERIRERYESKIAGRESRCADPEYVRDYIRLMATARRAENEWWLKDHQCNPVAPLFTRLHLRRYPLGVNLQEIADDIAECEKYKSLPGKFPFHQKS